MQDFVHQPYDQDAIIRTEVEGLLCLGFRVWGLGFRVWGLGFGAFGFRVWGLGLGFRV